MKNRQVDIERYLRGELSPAEMHALERDALNDPFLAEALEGIEQTGVDAFLYDVHSIRRSMDNRLKRRERWNAGSVRMWAWVSGIAATLLVIAISGFYVVSLLRQPDASSLAAENSRDPQQKTSAPADARSSAQGDRAAPDSSVSDAPAPPPQIAMNVPKPAQKPQPQPEVSIPELQVVEAEEVPVPAHELPAIEATPPARAQGGDVDTLQRAEAARAFAGDVVRKRSMETQAPARVTGVVTTADGEPLPGVNVVVRGTPTGTVTDHQGRYELAVDESAMLVFSFIGFAPYEIEAAPGSLVNVTLAEDHAALSEVVVTTGRGHARGEGVEPARITTAEPATGKKQFFAYLDTAVSYPERALNARVQGRVTVRFTVGTDGVLTGFQVVRGIGFGCDDALINAIRHGPAWRPAMRGNQPVAEEVKVRYRFELK